MKEENDNTEKEGLTRRALLGGSMKLTALAGVGAVAGFAVMTPETAYADNFNSLAMVEAAIKSADKGRKISINT